MTNVLIFGKKIYSGIIVSRGKFSLTIRETTGVLEGRKSTPIIIDSACSNVVASLKLVIVENAWVQAQSSV